MKKGVIGILVALFIACSVALYTACSKGEKGTTIEYATYESWDEGFSYLSIMDGFGRVSKSGEQKHGGNYSAKVQPLGSCTDPDTKPFFYYPMIVEGDSGYDYSDFTYLNNIKFYMYNAQEQEVAFEFCIIASVADIEGADCKAVQTVKLAPGEWTEVVYKPDYTALQNMCDVTSIAGIGFRFDNCKSSDIGSAPVLYLDDVTLNISEKQNIVITPSTPARGEIQSFDAASSLVYVNMDSGIDFAETWLPAGDAKLPAGVKGGVEFTISDAEIGTWPRLKFDSRTPQEELQNADYFSLLLYFDVPDASIDTIEIRMVPDTTEVYTEYVKANEWVELKIDPDIILNNWSTVIGVRSRGLFWVQNGLQGYCFNDIKAIRVADIKGVFNDIRVPAMQMGSVDTEYVLPEATLELNGAAVTAESWSYSVEYSDKALYEAKYGQIELSGREFTPKAGGTYIATYSAVYQGKTYVTEAEFEVNREVAADGEIESFNDPSSLENVKMESGRTYTATYLWAGDEKLEGAEGAQGGVSFAIPSSGGTGSWPMFYVTPRIPQSAVEDKGEVSFWIYLGVEDTSKLTAENKEIGIRVALFPRPGSTGDVRVDEYVMANTWTKITVSAASFASSYEAVSVGNTGFFWVQNGAPADIIGEIRIANIMATGGKVTRPEAAENEIENFKDAGSADSLRIPNDVTEIGWTENAPGGVAAAYATVKLPYRETVTENGEEKENVYEYYPAISVTARRTAAEYRSVAASKGYNVVTLEIYLDPVNDGDSGKLARMNYWAQQDGMNDSQGTLRIGEWVTLTLDLETYLTALENSEDDSVKLLWVHSTIDVPIETVYLRNVCLAESENILDLESEGLLLFESDNLNVAYSYETEVPQGQESALKAAFTNSGDNWPNVKFSADKNLLMGSEALLLTLYIEAEGADTVDAVMWPYGGKSADGVKLATNEWITLAFETDALLEVYNFSVSEGIANTNLFWFTNTQKVSAVYVASIAAGSLAEKNVAFADSGITVGNDVTMYEAGTPGVDARMDAWTDINSTKGYAYKLTITHEGETLVYGTDYTIGDKDGGLTIFNAEAGVYTLTFESYNGRFITGTTDLTVRAKDLSVSIGGGDTATSVIEEAFTFPAATLTGANDQANVSWSYTVDGAPQSDNFFTPDTAGEYTIKYIASYYGKTYEGTLTLTVTDYAVSVEEPQEGRTGDEYTLPKAELRSDISVIEGVTFTYEVIGPNEEIVSDVSSDGKFTPSMAGDYKVTYSVQYNETTYEKTVTVTIVRRAAQANEIELFGDESSVNNVRLESGSDFAKTYLEKGDERLPEGAEGGVSFAVTEGAQNEGNWPNLYFSSRMDDQAIGAFNTVVIRLYIGVKDGYDAGKVKVFLLDDKANALYVKPETWTEIEIPVSSYLAREMTLTANSILWIQNGEAATSLNEIDEVRIAGVYCTTKLSVMNMTDVEPFTGYQIWADGGLNTDNATTDSVSDLSLAPAGLDGISGRAIRMTENLDSGYTQSNKTGGVYIRPTMTAAELQKAQEDGYKTVMMYVYLSVLDDSVKPQITLLPDVANSSKVQYSVNCWVPVSVSFDRFMQAYNASTNAEKQVKLFTLEFVESNRLQEVWLAGFTLSEEEIVPFGNASAASYFWASNETPITYESDFNGFSAVKFTPNGNRMQIHLYSGEKELFNTTKQIKMRIFIQAADSSGNPAKVGLYHEGMENISVQTGEWTTITLTAKAESGDNGIFNVWGWYVDGTQTGWLNFNTGDEQDYCTVSAVYISGIWME